MLVLNRRIGEEILIANDIRLTVVATNGRQVRLGITAPISVPVHRSELIEGNSESTKAPKVMRKRQH